MKNKIFNVLILTEVEHLEAVEKQQFKTCELLIANKLLSIADRVFAQGILRKVIANKLEEVGKKTFYGNLFL